MSGRRFEESDVPAWKLRLWREWIGKPFVGRETGVVYGGEGDAVAGSPPGCPVGADTQDPGSEASD